MFSIATVWLSLLLSCLHPQTQVLDISEVKKAMEPAVLLHIKIYRTDPETLKTRKGMAGCSGVYIDGQTVLTAAHCFSDPSTNIFVQDVHGVTKDGKLIKIDPPTDLALVAVISKTPHTHVKFAKDARIGEKIVNIGSPFGLGLMVSEGVVARLGSHFKPFTGSYILQTGMINPGSSGGPAVNKDGELIGINTLTIGSMFGWAGISASVDLKTINAFLGRK